MKPRRQKNCTHSMLALFLAFCNGFCSVRLDMDKQAVKCTNDFVWLVASQVTHNIVPIIFYRFQLLTGYILLAQVMKKALQDSTGLCRPKIWIFYIAVEYYILIENTVAASVPWLVWSVCCCQFIVSRLYNSCTTPVFYDSWIPVNLGLVYYYFTFVVVSN